MEECKEPVDCLEISGKFGNVRLFRKSRDNYGNYPLHAAAYHNNVVVADNLIRRGWDIDAKNDKGKTPLDFAIQRDSLETAELLLKAGASLTSGLCTGTKLGSLLHSAAAYGSVKMVNWIIKAGDCNVNLKNHRGYTPLIYAIVSSKVNVVKVLVEAGSDLNDRYSNGFTPLILSIMEYQAGSNESYEIVKVLIEAGSNVNITDNRGMTALHRAGTTDKDSRLIPLLLQNGAEVNAVSSDGLLPIHAAITLDNYHAVKALIQAGSSIDCSVQGNNTILHYAMRSYEPKIIKLLLEKGASLHAVNDDDLEPFIYGVTSLHFLPNDDLSMINKDFEACLQSKLKCLKLLLKHGANINRVSSKLGTALNIALESDKIDKRVVFFLLNNKAIIDFNDKTVQDALSSLEKQEISRLLIKHVALCEMQSFRNDQIKNFDLYKMPQELQDHYRSCKTELEEMKKWEIVVNEFTLNDILIAKKISHYVRNENALQVIEKVSSLKLFPIYIDDLRRRFEKEAKKQSRFEEARNGLSRLFKREASSFSVVYDNILRFLSKHDLYNLSLI